MTEAAELQASAEADMAELVADASGFFWKLTHPADTSFQLGCKLVKEQRFQEAKFRFKFTLWRQPNRASAWHNLGICHLALSEVGEGIAALKRSLALNPKNESLLFLLATVQDGKYAEGREPHTTPVDMIRAEFGSRAEDYEEDELGERGYRGHFALHEAAEAVLADRDVFTHALDAGCGTGMLGELLRSITAKLTGIDLSPAMLAIAEKKTAQKNQPLYNELLTGDIRTHLLHLPEPCYDLIALANVAPIMGGLAPMVDGAARSLLPGGWLIFDATPLERGTGYHLQLSDRRFAHSKDYLNQLAEKSGLSLQPYVTEPIYPEQERWIIKLQKPK